MNILHFGKSHGSHRCKTLNNQAAVTVIKVLLKYLFWTMQMLLKKLWFYQLLKNFLVLEGYILMRESFKIPMEITSHSPLFTNNAPAKRLLCKCCWIKSGTKLLIRTISTATYGEEKWEEMTLMKSELQKGLREMCQEGLEKVWLFSYLFRVSNA